MADGPDPVSQDRAGTIRQAGQADVDAIVMLRGLMFAAMGVSPDLLDAPAWRTEARRWLEEKLGSVDVIAAVAEVDGQVVACALGEVTALAPAPGAPTGCVGLLSNVATLPEHRGRGFASRCTDAVIEWFDRETAVERIDLFATSAGRAIYERRGFTETPFPAMRRPRVRDTAAAS